MFNKVIYLNFKSVRPFPFSKMLPCFCPCTYNIPCLVFSHFRLMGAAVWARISMSLHVSLYIPKVFLMVKNDQFIRFLGQPSQQSLLPSKPPGQYRIDLDRPATHIWHSHWLCSRLSLWEDLCFVAQADIPLETLVKPVEACAPGRTRIWHSLGLPSFSIVGSGM